LIVNTQRLFIALLSTLEIDLICDVGSMNGADALKFRDSSPDSRIFAFEPNPENFRQMESNAVLRDRNIHLACLAATNRDGHADFFLVDADYSRRDYRRGMSSLFRRRGDERSSASVRVRTARLDTFLADKCGPAGRLALWIDAEGKAYEVIEGMTGIADRVRLLHIEVETRPCIGSHQKLYGDVKALLRELGFAEFATDQARSSSQFNALFIRSALPAVTRIAATATLVLALLRRRLIDLARVVCPMCLRRYQAMRPRAYDP
jgi:FkbM family methyltransferase